MRKCPLCHHNTHMLLYTQKFADGLVHRIVSCNACNFMFVENGKNSTYYHTYYKEDSKYNVTRDIDLHKKSSGLFKKYLHKNDAILDVGCSTGHLLGLLKKSGYKNVMGIEPSPFCKEVAWDEYGIPVFTGDLDSFALKKKYDAVILQFVLEHVWDVKQFIKKVKMFVSEKGYIFIAVPDVNSFAEHIEEPFAEFSTEHINFFSLEYIRKIVFPFEEVYSESYKGNIVSVWKKKNTSIESMKEYIEKSEKKMKDIQKSISHFPKPLLVWGAGSLTRRLLKSTDLNPIKIIDTNKCYIGKRIGNISIISPDELKVYPYPILIASYRFKEDILLVIKKMHIKNKILFFP